MTGRFVSVPFVVDGEVWNRVNLSTALRVNVYAETWGTPHLSQEIQQNTLAELAEHRLEPENPGELANALSILRDFDSSLEG